MGKTSETKGDTLAEPGTEYTYDLKAFDNAQEPVSVTSIQRVHHTNASYSPDQPDETIETVEYSDGFGRKAQTRVQAEDLDFGDAGMSSGSITDNVSGSAPSSGDPRVRVTGWKRYDNKGNVVEKWEPFFSEGFDFEDVANSPTGQSVQMHYDARGRTVRTVRPDGGENRVIFGVPGSIGAPDITTPGNFEPTPWERYTYDASDNAGRTPVEAPSEHHDTPTSVLFDAKGRTIRTVERNGQSSSDELVTETDYDIRGNVTKVIDPEGRDATVQVFDLADQKLRTESIDAGNSVSVFDAAGISVETRDAKGGLSLKRADNLGRTTHVWGRDQTGESVRLCERVIFGDAAGGPSSPKAGNHLGKPYRHYDEAGRVNFVSYDFKGNQIEQTRRVIDPQHMIDAYNAADSSTNWEVDTYRVDWTTSSGQTLGDRASQLLKPRDYTVTKAYDGLDRALAIQYPADKHGDRAVAEPAYNKAGNLQSVTLDGNAYVERIAYNPRGQRILAALGNGAMVRYEYDDVTFRLARLRSEGYTKPDQTTYSPDGPVHQDFTYTYDAAGNITELDSDSANVGVGGSDHLQRVFEYDPIYRLKKATGREYSATKTYPWEDNGGNSDDPTQTHDYTELYEYDDVGNMTKLTHQYDNNTGTWTRNFSHETASNQLNTMNDGGGTTRSYTYDAAGNLTAENTNRKHEWDWGGRMRSFRNQTSGSQATVFTHYTYDSGGQRTQKVVCKDNDNPVHTVYIGGIYEHHEQISSGSVTAENNFLHVMDDSRRVAIKRIGAHLDGTNPATIQYHLGDHLQSSSVVLDGSGNFFNREEYRPYGETSFGSYDKKRYRFTGQERDEESGLNYHGARYYAPWAAKWTTPDPAGFVDGPNPYLYTNADPIGGRDALGLQDESEQNDSAEEHIKTLHGEVEPQEKSEVKVPKSINSPQKGGFSNLEQISNDLQGYLEKRQKHAAKNYKNEETSGFLKRKSPAKVRVYELTKTGIQDHVSAGEVESANPQDIKQELEQSGRTDVQPKELDIFWHTQPDTAVPSSTDITVAAKQTKTFLTVGPEETTVLFTVDENKKQTKLEQWYEAARESGALFPKRYAADYARAEWEAIYESAEDIEGLESEKARRAYASLTLAHKLGLGFKRRDHETGELIRVDISSEEARIEAANNLTQSDNNGASDDE